MPAEVKEPSSVRTELTAGLNTSLEVLALLHQLHEDVDGYQPGPDGVEEKPKADPTMLSVATANARQWEEALHSIRVLAQKLLG